MKERPILFNADMVRALLDVRKTQTRRIVKPQPTVNVDHFRHVTTCRKTGRMEWQACNREGKPVFAFKKKPCFVSEIAQCPYGQPGDRLWVREAFADGLCTKSTLACRATHRPSDLDEGWDDPIKWKPSIFMPRSYSRITLEIVSVRVERLQDISEADAKAEGVIGKEQAAENGLSWYDKPRRAFRFLWQSINGADSWDANPWVWVVEFKRVEAA
jgi:hypothetical protein